MPTQMADLEEVTSWLKEELKKERTPWIKPWTNLSVRIAGENFPMNGWPSNIRSPRSYYAPLNMVFLMHQWQKRKANYNSDLYITRHTLENLKIKIPDEEPYKVVNMFSGSMGGYVFILREVFHVEQIENCEKVIGFSFVDFDAGVYGYSYKRSENALEALKQRHRMRIHEGKRYAAFNLVTEEVSMPGMGQFIEVHGKNNAEGHYWATMWHEIVHWTGHRYRLDRPQGMEESVYAKEELVAEIGSAYLCANFGVEGKLQHADYIHSWLKVLDDEGDKALADAFVSAQKAAKWVLDESRNQRRNADEG